MNVVELTNLAHKNLEAMSNRDLAAFWSILPRVLQIRHGQTDLELEKKLKDIIDTTCRRMGGFWCRDLAQTALGLAKTIKEVTNGNQQHHRGARQVLQSLLASGEQRLRIFGCVVWKK